MRFEPSALLFGAACFVAAYLIWKAAPGSFRANERITSRLLFVKRPRAHPPAYVRFVRVTITGIFVLFGLIVIVTSLFVRPS